MGTLSFSFFFLINLFRLGIEGLVTFKHDMQFDAETYMITVNGTTIAVFDKVTVRIEVEKDKNTQRGKVKMSLVNPIDSRNL
jgi:exosome complex exonuclease DIS3/RRP44